MLDKNSRKKTNIEFISKLVYLKKLIMLNCQLLNESLKRIVHLLTNIDSFEFRLKIIRTNRSKGISETKFSKRVALKESLMFFDDNKILLYLLIYN